MIERLSNWWHSLRYSVRNLWWFLPVVWRWRDWDYEFTYELFMVGVHRMANGIERRKAHVGVEDDVADMRRVLDLWVLYMDVADGDEAEECWQEMHELLAERAGHWWD